MASLKPALTSEEVKRVGVSEIRKKYNDLATVYNKMLDREMLLCPQCGEFYKAEAFYMDRSYATERYPICKRCLLRIVEQRKTDRDEPHETKESVQKVLQMMNKVYDDKFYEDCIKGAYDEVKEKNRTSPFATYITAISSLPQWKGKTWEDSYFGEESSLQSEDEINENSRILKTARKRFGKDYSNADLVFLENEYEDWTTRYSCENKAQELLFKRICFTTLNIEKAQRDGKDTKELDKTLQELMTSSQIKPSQSNSNALTESKTFGQLIDKWEKEKPIPEPEGEFKDIDKIGLLIDVFFKGHLSKMMGLKNAFSNTYEQYIKKYTVNKPQYDEESDVEGLFDQIFGSRIDED